MDDPIEDFNRSCWRQPFPALFVPKMQLLVVPTTPPAGTHRPVEGDEFMPYGWCGGCETCSRSSCPQVCVACSYHPLTGVPMEPVTWPCPPIKKAIEDATSEPF